MSKQFFVLVLCIACVFATPPRPARTYRPDDVEFDGQTRADHYTVCKSKANQGMAPTLVSTGKNAIGGTACVIYSGSGKDIQVSVTHNMMPTMTKMLTVSMLQTGGGMFTTTFEADARTCTAAGVCTTPATAFVDLFRMPLTAATTPGNDFAALNPQLADVVGNTAVFTITVTFVDGRTLTFNIYPYDITQTLEAPTRPRTERNRDNRKFVSYVQTFYPLGKRVLVNRKPRGKSAQQYWGSSHFTVVATGPEVTMVKEGQDIMVNTASCLSQMVSLNTQYYPVDDVLTFSPYCWVLESDVIGAVSEKTNGANRGVPQNGHIKQANPTGWMWAPNNAYQGFY